MARTKERMAPLQGAHGGGFAGTAPSWRFWARPRRCRAMPWRRRQARGVAWRACLLLACQATIAEAWSSALPQWDCQAQAHPDIDARASLVAPGPLAFARMSRCAISPRQWAAHRSSLRRVTHWPACRPDAPPGTCERPRCVSALDANPAACPMARRLTSAISEDRHFVAADAKGELTPQSRREPP